MTSTSDEVGHTLDLDAIEARVNAALEGPWSVDSHALGIWGPSRKGGETKLLDIRGWGYLTGHGHGALALPADEATAIQKAMGEFVAHARTDIPALVAECRSLRNSHDSLVKALEPFANLGVGVGPDDEVDDAPYRILRGAIHNARAALSQAKGGK